MELSYREGLTVIHGLVLGTAFLLAFAGGLAGLWSLRPGFLTAAGIRERMRRLYIGTWGMAVAAWATVITGTWIVYPWYRAKLAESGADEFAGCAGHVLPSATCSPRDFLRSEVAGNTRQWHEFGMEWKEHIAWLSPILATVAAFIVVYYGVNLVRHDRVRRTAMTLFVLSFVCAVVAGALCHAVARVARRRHDRTTVGADPRRLHVVGLAARDARSLAAGDRQRIQVSEQLEDERAPVARQVQWHPGSFGRRERQGAIRDERQRAGSHGIGRRLVIVLPGLRKRPRRSRKTDPDHDGGDETERGAPVPEVEHFERQINLGVDEEGDM